MKICLKSWNEYVVTDEIVKSTLLEFSTILSVSDESEAVIFSPETNVPITFVRLTFVVDVPSPNTRPVAPLVTPVTRTPSAWFAVSVGLGVPLRVRTVNGLRSNKNNLYCEVVLEEVAPAVPL